MARHTRFQSASTAPILTHTRAAALLGAALLLAILPSPAPAKEISFSRDILPILSENCFRCHGPDASSRKADLRLDIHEEALADHEGKHAVVPGKPGESEMIARITSDLDDERMPPPKSGKTLTPAQIEKLRAWIEQGAAWEKHWAFVPPEKPALPATTISYWIINPIDSFVLARLEREGLSPSPKADPAALLRRLSLDLTGLPPTLDEIDRFLAKDPEAAYGEAVDRILASPHYGERWARQWLDSAQYADSDGFEKDKPRFVWAWRDWVINAFNANMPYDRFVREQIAGDLMPNARQDQIVATGFLRNSMINEEGGIDPEQFRMEAMFNRMDVIGRAVLGLTVNCAQCHDHKYDPLSQSDYYRLMAYVNNSHEACVTVYSKADEEKQRALRDRLSDMDDAFKAANPDWNTKLAAWQKEVEAQPRPEWHNLDLTFDDSTDGGQKFIARGDASYVASGYAPTRFSPKMTGEAPMQEITAVRLELLNDPNLPRGGPGRSIYGALALTEFEIYTAPRIQPGDKQDGWERVKIASAIADVNPPKRPLGPEFPDKGKREAFTGPIAMAIDGDGNTAWTTDDGPDRRNQPRYAIFTLEKPLTLPADRHIGIRLNQNHGGHDSDNNQNNNVGRFRISVTDSKALPARVVSPKSEEILARKPNWSKIDETDLYRYWLETSGAYPMVTALQEKVWQELPSGTTQLVYAERTDPRETHRLERGNFLKPLERVEPGTPSWLNPMPENAPKNRLGLAQWLTDPRAPTTARAFVNRVWQNFFGVGLVDTPSDLGLQGSRPSHPELLDWLAVTFVESGWDMKALQKLIVTSATYRQSSRVTPELLEKDPANRLLARGARFRVDGEIVRDITLAASGLLNPEVGGPSVYPPAPEFLFVPPASYGPKVWNTEKDAERYRRAIYTFRFRSVAYPPLQVFDTPDGSAPCVRRERSNTPLQALTVLNEPLFVECAKSLAKETLARKSATDAEQIDWAFRRCTARNPAPEEFEALEGFLLKQRKRIAEDQLKSASIIEKEGADPELAAWTLTARVMLSLDETMTRQ